MCELVAYFRVSTEKQGRSGLGLAAQETAVENYARSVGKTISAHFTEIEGGNNNERIALSDALDYCELTGARLLIAKIDRLSRNVGFVSRLQDSGAKFVAADMPEANETMVQIMSVMAQAERKAISERTKLALQAAKARKQVLGNPNMEAVRAARKDVNSTLAKARLIRSEGSMSRAIKVMVQIEKAGSAGATTLQEIADYLNGKGMKTPRLSNWTRAAVSRVVKAAG
ncbi:MAG: DNA invertase Pin-like site-specific DNA recombinase [Oleiphilaceae bacterium]|jgi:DNA invertase Pin-like site-specific DNA recombinase